MKLICFFAFSVLSLTFLPALLWAQHARPPAPQLDSLMLDDRISTFRVPRPIKSRQAGIFAATLQLNYVTSGLFGDTCAAGWSDDAKTAAAAAAAVWSELLGATVPISIDLCWATNLGAGVLGHGGAINYSRDFSGAPRALTWYPMALANQLYGSDIDAGSSDIYIALNSTYSWYYGTDGSTPIGSIDLMSVMLHEIGHGLGILSTLDVSGGLGSWGVGWDGKYTAYDYYIYNGSSQQLVSFSTPSAGLATQLTSDAVYFTGSSATTANGGSAAKLYAPTSWSSSSISHLDDIFNDTDNALMTYSLAYGESVHSPGPVTLGILQDMGWSLVQSDLALSLTLSSASAVVGTDTSYQASVTNNGPDAAEGVVATLTLPLDATLQSATPEQGSCAAVGLTLTCSLGTMSAAQSVTIALILVPASTGEITLSGQVAADQTDPTSGNNSASLSTTVSEFPTPTPTPSATPSATPTPDLPDLRVAVRGKLRCAGSSCTIGFRAKNQGSAAAGAFIIGVYASKNKTFDRKDRILRSASLRAGLAAGTSKLMSGYKFTWRLRSGERYVLLVIDRTGAVSESNESNNTTYAARW